MKKVSFYLKRNLYLVILTVEIIFGHNLYANTKNTGFTHLFSFETKYLLAGIQNGGIGFGFSYEQSIRDYMSVKGTFSHMTIPTEFSDLYCATVSISAAVNYYPFAMNLNKFYIGPSCTTDFLCYFGTENRPVVPEDTIISIGPVIGWKQRISSIPLGKYHISCIADIYGGWQFILKNSNNLKNAAKYSDAGFQSGIKFKILYRY